MEQSNNTSATPPAPSAHKPPIFGIISTVLGAASLLPFLGIVSFIALPLGIVGIKKDETKTVAIIGTALSVIGFISSPFIWALIGNVLTPPEMAKDPVAAGRYWGVVAFIAVVAAGFAAVAIKKRLDKK